MHEDPESPDRAGAAPAELKPDRPQDSALGLCRICGDRLPWKKGKYCGRACAKEGRNREQNRQRAIARERARSSAGH
jgi:hypothetical protein